MSRIAGLANGCANKAEEAVVKYARKAETAVLEEWELLECMYRDKQADDLDRRTIDGRMQTLAVKLQAIRRLL